MLVDEPPLPRGKGEISEADHDPDQIRRDPRLNQMWM
jgi:hypothetical protein